MELYPFTKNFFRKTSVQYVTVWLVRIWTYKNADETAHTFSRRSKNVKKRTKTDEKRILCEFTFRPFITRPNVNRSNMDLTSTNLKVLTRATGAAKGGN